MTRPRSPPPRPRPRAPPGGPDRRRGRGLRPAAIRSPSSPPRTSSPRSRRADARRSTSARVGWGASESPSSSRRRTPSRRRISPSVSRPVSSIRLSALAAASPSAAGDHARHGLGLDDHGADPVGDRGLELAGDPRRARPRPRARPAPGLVALELARAIPELAARRARLRTARPIRYGVAAEDAEPHLLGRPDRRRPSRLRRRRQEQGHDHAASRTERAPVARDRVQADHQGEERGRPACRRRSRRSAPKLPQSPRSPTATSTGRERRRGAWHRQQ